jgi:hypothetical protein
MNTGYIYMYLEKLILSATNMPFNLEQSIYGSAVPSSYGEIPMDLRKENGGMGVSFDPQTPDSYQSCNGVESWLSSLFYMNTGYIYMYLEKLILSQPHVALYDRLVNADEEIQENQ